ncbi:ABC transporter substrate-binding protein [Pseudoduganella lutea]|uniref:Transcriptional regulator n=1 Tax=Pseudoduganella lutea TaxID=321985 RepID=A0A4P6L377_9BURK|nr:ABC transporter substrate-binding protein [Pseudoduganella lutea]QBE65889.1 transcriptional regulator [Pseudoduganella lutea]
MKRQALCACIAAIGLALAGQAGAARPLKAVGVAVSDLANPYFVAIGKGAGDAARKIGGSKVRVTTVSSKYDLNTQVGQIENFIASKVDILVVNATDPKGIAPVLQKARDAGIVVMAVDVGADNADATIMSDNTMAGVESCKRIVQRLNGKGNVVIVNGPPVTAVIARVAGCKRAFAGTAIRIVSDNQDAKGSLDGGMEVMTNLLTAHRRIDAVFAINDPSAIGAELAVKQAGRGDVRMVASVDGAPDAEAALKSRNSIFAVTAAQDPYRMATLAIEIGYGIMHGKRPANSTVLIPTPAITKENVAAYKGWASH